MTAVPGARSCIFCQGSPLTKEHVWPRWLAKQAGIDAELNQVVPSDERRPIKRLRVVNGQTSTWLEEKGRSPKQSDHVVRAVCAGCNSGWMADLEGTCKPILTRQMADRNHVPSAFEREVLVRWLIKTTAVYEMDDPQSVVLPSHERARLAHGPVGDDGLWEVDAVWVPGPEMFALGHGRAIIGTTDGREIGQSLLQVLWIGHAGYVVQYRSTHDIKTRKMRLVNRRSLLTPVEPARRRPIVNPLGWWRLVEGHYTTKVR